MSKYPPWPHHLVFNFAYGRWCTVFVLFLTIYLFFHLAGAMTRIREEAIPLFFCFVIAYIIPASHYVSAQTLAAFDSLKPSLNLSEAELADIRESLERVPVKSQIRTLAVGLLAGISHDYLLLTSQGGLWETLQLLDGRNIAIMLVAIFTWCLLSTVIFFLIGNVRVFAKLAKNHVRIDLLNGADLYGFARVAVYSTLILMGALASFPLLLLEEETNYLSVVPGFLATSLPMVFIFLVPLLPIRKRLRERKAGELQSIQDRIRQLAKNENNLLENSAALQQLQPLLDYRREIRQVKEWPFDSPAFFRLLFYLFIPPLTWVGAALIERLVDTVTF